MYFNEARNKAKGGDKLNLKFGRSETFITVGEKGNFSLSWDQYESDKWEIIPAEPKVLDPKEYAGEMFQEYMETTGSRAGWFKKIALKMHKNGRIERDTEWLRCLDKSIRGVELINVIFLKERIKENLKPLNKDD